MLGPRYIYTILIGLRYILTLILLFCASGRRLLLLLFHVIQLLQRKLCFFVIGKLIARMSLTID